MTEAGTRAAPVEERAIDVDTGVRLHYAEQGSGEPLVLIHGGGKDLHYFDDELPLFARRFRCIAYSRRYASPNENGAFVPGYNATVDAADLDALLRALGVDEPVWIVGASIGGVAAMYHAVAHPERVRAMSLAEPPVLRWAFDVPGGREAFDEFYEKGFRPAGEAFAAGDDRRGMAHLIDAFLGPGTFDRLPERSRRRALAGARDWASQTTSSASFPEFPRADAARLTTPTLLLTGERTLPLHALVDEELAKVLPNCRRVTIPGATHDMWADAGDVCARETLAFFDTVRG
jgi:non-heme chloroperoxidase